jgi:hypothetical protein
MAGVLAMLVGMMSGELALLLPPTAALTPGAWLGAPPLGVRCLLSGSLAARVPPPGAFDAQPKDASARQARSFPEY